VSEFLSPTWLESLNATLNAAGPVPLEDGLAAFRIVFEFDNAPATVPHALTITLSDTGAFAEAGDHLMADALLRLSYDDAKGIFEGSGDSAAALRQGRVKARGDLSTLIPLLGWMQEARLTH